MKKLFEVMIEKTIYVLADDEREAELEAQTYESEEDGDVQVRSEITSIEQVYNQWRDSLPYGGKEDLTIRQLLEQETPPAPFVDPPEQLKIDFQEGAQPV